MRGGMEADHRLRHNVSRCPVMRGTCRGLSSRGFLHRQVTDSLECSLGIGLNEDEGCVDKFVDEPSVDSSNQESDTTS
jgi:hypothetical protein